MSSNTDEIKQERKDDDIAVQFDHVCKRYKLYNNDRDRLLGLFDPKGKRLLGITEANKDLSFTIRRGEAVAFVGNNGAGKSTALKMVTGVVHPTSGTVTVNGTVSALLELNAGFDGQLSGRENLELRSQILGIPKDEFAKIEEKIIEFAELGTYIDQPLKTYSSGMKARLGFSMAASIDPDILVVDEALSVGDRKFKKKCLERMHEIMHREGVTVLFVTHESKAAQELCTRGIVMDKGQMLFDGPIKEAIDFYNTNC
jgi:teichoic acid transport system ATP-binding protein